MTILARKEKAAQLPPSLRDYLSDSDSLLAAERSDANLLLVFVDGPTRVVRIENHRSSDIVGIHHPAQLRHVDNAPIGNFRTAGGNLLSEKQCLLALQRRTYGLNIGHVQRNKDLRPNVLDIEKWVTDTVCRQAQSSDGAELDVRGRERIHNLEQVRSDQRVPGGAYPRIVRTALRRAGQPGIGTKALH
jgi:hypothetical protein